MHSETLKAIRDARAISTPIITVETADPFAAVARLVDEYDPRKNPTQKIAPPILAWDAIRAYQGANDAGADALRAMLPAADPLGLPGVRPDTNPIEALKIAQDAPAGAVLVFIGADAILSPDAWQAIQAAANLRDPFKATRRTLVLLAPAWPPLPAALRQDALMLIDPLPTAAELATLATTEIENFATSKAAPDDYPTTRPTANDCAAAGAALLGLARFPAEQTIAQSLRATAGKLDAGILWTRKRAYIAQTPGLTVETTEITLDDVIGVDAYVQTLRRICEGPEAPAVIVRLEELEKQLAGAAGRQGSGDGTGTQAYALAALLSAMEDRQWTGAIGFGVPGTGKSYISAAAAGSYGLPCLTLDIGATRGSLVGQSEAQIRAALAVLYAIGGNRVLFLASCNGVASIPAPLRSRFADGLYYFDLPRPEHLEGAWNLYRAKYGITEPAPPVVDWTPREVRNACRAAYRQRIPLAEAARGIVPVSQSDRAGLAEMRSTAHGAFLDATTGRAYDARATSPTAPAGGRAYQE